MARERVLTVTKDDCHWDYFRAGGNGGQKQNKTSSGARCTHPPSGAVGESREERSQLQNRRTAFRRMAEAPKFRVWVADMHAQFSRGETVEREVERMMEPENIRVEVRQDGKWVAA